MMDLTTVSDYNYLSKGLTLYESLKEKNKNFVLHYLCIDNKSFNKLKQYESETLKVYSCDELISQDNSFSFLKIIDYKYFCWSLASYFTDWLLKRINKSVCYIDSDIFFYEDISSLYKEFGDSDVAIFRHRQFNLNRNYPEGWFNVGVVYFNNSEKGKSILEWWSDAVKNKKYPKLATCGDQKYLDEFPKLTDKIFIDGNIGHGAPWQWQLFDLSNFVNDGSIIWEGKKQKLFFSHFSQFVYGENNYIPSNMHHIYTPLTMYYNDKSLKFIYDEYYNKLKKTINNYGL